MATLERVQRRESHQVHDDYNLCYIDRPVKLSLLPISYRHEQRDLCILHKLLNNAYDIKTSIYVSPKTILKERLSVREYCNTFCFNSKQICFRFLKSQSAENVQNWALFVAKQLLRQCCALIGYTCAVY